MSDIIRREIVSAPGSTIYAERLVMSEEYREHISRAMEQGRSSALADWPNWRHVFRSLLGQGLK